MLVWCLPKLFSNDMDIILWSYTIASLIWTIIQPADELTAAHNLSCFYLPQYSERYKGRKLKRNKYHFRYNLYQKLDIPMNNICTYNLYICLFHRSKSTHTVLLYT